MSRSIHANRSETQWRRTGAIDWDAIDDKRGLKAAVQRDRRLPDGPLPHTEAADVRVTVVDPSPRWFHPVSPDDVRAVLARLPRGVTTGLREIRIEPGRRQVNAIARPVSAAGLDPLGRAAYVVAHGVLAPAVLGVYLTRHQAIRLFGYVRASRKPLTRRQQVDLELHALSTLVHEVAHHYDLVMRMGAGRSWQQRATHAEDYAERVEHQWVMEAVIPYLQDRHGEEHGARLRKLTLQPPGRARNRRPLSKSARRRELRAALASFKSKKTRRWIMSSDSALALSRWNHALARDDLPFKAASAPRRPCRPRPERTPA